MDKGETYLGDAVAAWFDCHTVWLRTTDGNDQRIALEPFVFDALVKYRDDMEEPLAREMGESEND